jgi:hypothetical protein
MTRKIDSWIAQRKLPSVGYGRALLHLLVGAEVTSKKLFAEVSASLKIC